MKITNKPIAPPPPPPAPKTEAAPKNQVAEKPKAEAAAKNQVVEKAKTETAAQVAEKGSNFTAAPTAASKEPVSLKPSGPAPAQGRLSLDSPEARVAVQKSVEHLQQKVDGAAQGIVPGISAAQSVSPRSVERDNLGMTHVRMDRMHEGTKVFGEQLVSHLDKEGQVSSVTGELGKIPAGLGRDPVKLSAKDALAVAQKDFGTKMDADRPPTTERVVVQDKEGNYHAAYHVEMNHMNNLGETERPRRMNYLIDANSGKMLESFNQMGGVELPHAGHDAHGARGASTPSTPTTPTTPTTPGKPAPVPAAGDDTSLYSGKVNLSTTKQKDGTYTLEDSTRGKGVVTYDAKNAPQASGKTQFTDKNDTWGEAGDNSRTKAAVDAHYGAQMTYDFYKDILGRDSIDGKGEQLKSYVHTDKNLVNAFWDGEKMSYGDGDGKDAGPLTTLDIAGHEITHGLTERTAGLVYSGESGGLNESFSDIMGAGVEWYASQKNKAVEFDWKVGEDAWTPANGTGDALRYMDDPKKDGYSIDNYKDYPKQTEVHGSSGIANNAFYLLVQGGTNRTSGQKVDGGIGMEAGLKIYGRALEHYMTPRTNFSQARQATLNAAKDLFGADSKEYKKVAETWTAVGVK